MAQKEKKVTITIGFYRPEQLDVCSSCLYSHKTDAKRIYTHVELRFSDNSITSITRDPGTVHYFKAGKDLSRQGYTCFFEIDVNSSLELAMKDYAQDCADKEIPFNYWGMYFNFIPILNTFYTYDSECTSFFCSEYIVHVLQKGGMFGDLIPHLTTPNMLYEALKNSPITDISFNKTLYYK